MLRIRLLFVLNLWIRFDVVGVDRMLFCLIMYFIVLLVVVICRMI